MNASTRLHGQIPPRRLGLHRLADCRFDLAQFIGGDDAHRRERDTISTGTWPLLSSRVTH